MNKRILLILCIAFTLYSNAQASIERNKEVKPFTMPYNYIPNDSVLNSIIFQGFTHVNNISFHVKWLKLKQYVSNTLNNSVGLLVFVDNRVNKLLGYQIVDLDSKGFQLNILCFVKDKKWILIKTSNANDCYQNIIDKILYKKGD